MTRNIIYEKHHGSTKSNRFDTDFGLLLPLLFNVVCFFFLVLYHLFGHHAAVYFVDQQKMSRENEAGTSFTPMHVQ